MTESRLDLSALQRAAAALELALELLDRHRGAAHERRLLEAMEVRLR